MSRVILYLAIAVVFVILARLLFQSRAKIDFFITGLDSQFKIPEIRLLYKIAKASQLEEPLALYWSIPALNHGIAFILKDARERHIENTPQVQAFLAKLFNYRTQVELDPKNSHSLKTTRGLAPGQRVRIVLRGTGVYTSTITHVGRDLVLALPLKKGVPVRTSVNWANKTISVYLERSGDAGYVFDTLVKSVSAFNGGASLICEHTDKLVRSQKRRSVRVPCHLPAALYLMNQDTMSTTRPESAPGLKCVLEDLSEDGAMVRVGGTGKKNLKIKLQFELEGNLIVMSGVVRAFEYNEKIKQSRLHFECITIEPNAKNYILQYVYNILPEERKEEYEALSGVHTDAEQDSKALEEALSVARSTASADGDPLVITEEDLFGNDFVRKFPEGDKAGLGGAVVEHERVGQVKPLAEAVSEVLDEIPLVG